MQFARITHDISVMGDKACIRGLRVTVSTVLGLLAAGKSRERIRKAYPYLEAQDINAALTYAAWIGRIGRSSDYHQRSLFEDSKFHRLRFP